jgi:hypothetical protein
LDPVTKEPKSLEGLDLSNIDQEKARLDNIIREGLEPRLPVALENLGQMDIPTPVFVFLTLLDVKGRMLRHGYRLIYNLMSGNALDRNVLLLPEVTIFDYDITASQLMKPVFDAVWNACGYARSFNYNDKGEWTEGKG